ncbi:MAG: hypothetical protein E7374_00700 [Clostridiales bacterium]|nr:hypothetical protein [Clostridiales bacterium]
MSITNKAGLSKIVYYSLAILTVLCSAWFVFALLARDLTMWAKVVYFVWTGLVIGAVIFDVICTMTSENKIISGLIVYVLSILAVVMAAILYMMNTTKAGLAVDFFNLFISVSLISLITTGFLIATWCVGERLVTNTKTNDKIEGK